jgi:hypothetical protein
MMKLACVLILALALLSGCQTAQSDPTSVITSFTYTAPGDDGAVGQASVTQIRMALTSDSLVSNWEDCWIVSEHVPWAPGVKDTIMVTVSIETGVPYFFAVKVADEVPNWSLLSNIISRTYADVDMPIPVTDFDFGD